MPWSCAQSPGIEADCIRIFADKQPGIATGGEKVTLAWNVPNARHVKIMAQGQYPLTEQFGALDTGTLDIYPNKNTTYQDRKSVV